MSYEYCNIHWQYLKNVALRKIKHCVLQIFKHLSNRIFRINFTAHEKPGNTRNDKYHRFEIFLLINVTSRAEFEITQVINEVTIKPCEMHVKELWMSLIYVRSRLTYSRRRVRRSFTGVESSHFMKCAQTQAANLIFGNTTPSPAPIIIFKSN